MDLVTATWIAQQGIEWLPMVVAVAAGISAAVPDSGLGRVAGLLNTLALNIGKAANDPAKQGGDDGER